jgi:hypothetical protein
MKVSHAVLAFLSGLVWIVVGCFLLPLGLRLLLGDIETDQATTLPLFLVALGLFVGHMKGRHVLGKAAQKGIERIKSMPNPANLGKIYSAKYYLLLGGMVALGLSIKYLGIPNPIRGTVDVAIGAALIQGSLVYIRFAVDSWRKVDAT